MQFEYSAKNAAFVRQHGRCAKCGKFLKMVYEDRRGHDGAWTAHDLVPLDEGGSDKAHNCVILCITDPDCHLNFAHAGHPRERVFLTPFSFPNWVFRGDGEQNPPEAADGRTRVSVRETNASHIPYRAPATGHAPWTAPAASARVRPLPGQAVRP